MNDYQLQLFNNLQHLADTTETFYFVDRVYSDKTYRIFNYRLTSYTQFCLPSATECRGTTFEVDALGNPIRLASLPLHKFFNLNECPTTMNLDLTTIKRIMVKHDGSLISSYMHDNNLRLKSKGSLASGQALDAMTWIDQPEHSEFKQKVLHYTERDCTVIMEWTSQSNRIVLSYDKPMLFVLHVRDNTTGEYLHTQMFLDSDYICADVEVEDPVAFTHSVPNMTNSIEGFVCVLTDNTWFKLKTTKYISLHHTKDSINCPRRLFDACVNDAVDDMRSMFYDDPQAIKLIDGMQKLVENHFNHMVSTVETFYTTNKQHDRRDFAIAAGKELTKQEFGLVMNMYLQRPVDYKASMKKNWKSYGISSDDTEKQ